MTGGTDRFVDAGDAVALVAALDDHGCVSQ